MQRFSTSKPIHLRLCEVAIVNAQGGPSLSHKVGYRHYWKIVQFNCNSNSIEIDLVYLRCTKYYQRVLYAHPKGMEANESNTEIVTIQ